MRCTPQGRGEPPVSFGEFPTYVQVFESLLGSSGKEKPSLNDEDFITRCSQADACKKTKKQKRLLGFYLELTRELPSVRWFEG